MIQIFLALFILVSLAIDTYIYFAFLRKRDSRALKVIYFTTVALSYVALLTSVLVIRWLSHEAQEGVFRIGMWLIWFFILVGIPKLIFTLVSWPDIVIGGLSKRKVWVFTWLALSLAVTAMLLIADGAFFGRRDLRVERIVLEYGNLPPSFDGLRIVQFSDTHIGGMVNSAKLLDRMVDSINALNPDIVIQSGDLVNLYYTELTPEILEILSRIEARHGVFAIYGNHDLGFYVKRGIDYQENIDEIRRLQEDLGWTFLNNESVFLRLGDDSIAISGVGFPVEAGHNGFNSNMAGADFEAAFASLPDSIFNITISHTPQSWRTITGMGQGDLVLSGHVHAMQSKIQIGRWRWSPAQYMYEEWSGLYEDAGRCLYINDGIGCVIYPMRVGASRPEITLIELRRKQ